MRIGALAMLMLCTVLAGACAPYVVPPGKTVQKPALTDDHIRTADGLDLPLRVWRAEGPVKSVVLALHGFNDYSKSFEDPAKVWTKAGITVYAYDQRGFGAAPNHGLWPGTAALTGDLAAVSRLLRARYPDVPLYLVGESMGSAVILAAYGDADPPTADGVVLAAPAVWSRSHMPFYQRGGLWLLAHTLPWMKLTGEGLKIRASDNDAMLRALGRDPLVIKATRVDALAGLTDLMDEALAAAPKLDVPALVMYGREEQLIPEDARHDLLARLPKNGLWRFAEYDTGFHMLMRDRNAGPVLADIAAFATTPATRPPTIEYAKQAAVHH